MITRELAKKLDDGMTVLRVGKRPTHTLTSVNMWAALGLLGTTATAALAVTNPAFGDAVLQGLLATDTTSALASTAVVGLSAVGAYVLHRFETRWMRDGWFGDAPDEIKRNAASDLDTELTATYRDTFGDDDVVVERRDASQFVVHIIYHDDLPIWNKLTVLARKLGIKSKAGKPGNESIPVIFMDVYDKGCSALIIPKAPSEWGAPVALNPSVLEVGKPIVHVGDAIDGTAMVADFRLEHGMLVAGTSGAGKSEVFVAVYRSLELAQVKGHRIIIDLKGTPQLRRLKADEYLTSVEDAVVALAKIDTDLKERQAKYSDADCDNLWQYQKKVDANEGAYILFIDELAVLSRIEDKAKREVAMTLLTSIAQLGRSAGLILIVGMQHPLAEDIPTKIRNQLMIRCILAVADAKASEVTGVLGAQHLPMQGGMLFRHGGNLTIGRGVYLSA